MLLQGTEISNFALKLSIDNPIIYDDLGYRKRQRIHKFFRHGKRDVSPDEFDNRYHTNGPFVVKETTVHRRVYRRMGHKLQLRQLDLQQRHLHCGIQWSHRVMWLHDIHMHQGRGCHFVFIKLWYVTFFQELKQYFCIANQFKNRVVLKPYQTIFFSVGSSTGNR